MLSLNSAFVGVGRIAPDEERLVLLKPVVQFSFIYGVARGFLYICLYFNHQFLYVLWKQILFKNNYTLVKICYSPTSKVFLFFGKKKCVKYLFKKQVKICILKDNFSKKNVIRLIWWENKMPILTADVYFCTFFLFKRQLFNDKIQTFKY